MDRITVYPTEPCSLCSRVNGLLAAREVEFVEVNLAKEARSVGAAPCAAGVFANAACLMFRALAMCRRSITNAPPENAARRDHPRIGTLTPALKRRAAVCAVPIVVER